MHGQLVAPQPARLIAARRARALTGDQRPVHGRRLWGRQHVVAPRGLARERDRRVAVDGTADNPAAVADPSDEG